MSDEQTPEPRTASMWTTCAIVFAAMIAGVSIVAGSYYLGLREETELRINESDLALLIRTSDFEESLFDVVIRSDWETIRKVRRRDKSVHLEYDYSHDDDGIRFQIACSMSSLPTRRDAQTAFKDQKSSWLTLLTDDITPKQSNAFQWGDDSEFGAFIRAEETIGHFFSCRRRDKVFRVELLGTRLVENDSLMQILRDHLDRLETYSADADLPSR